MSDGQGGAFLVDVADMMIALPVRVTALLAAVAVSAVSANAALATPGQSSAGGTPPTYQVLRQDVIINADIWAAKPEMMAAGLGTELRNNYIDIVLDGSEAAARRITTVEIPSTGRYKPLYNPGGPGNDPAPGVHYSAPSPPISEHVIMALTNPMTVTYVHCPRSAGCPAG
jgi:hypothetical protein